MKKSLCPRKGQKRRENRGGQPVGTYVSTCWDVFALMRAFTAERNRLHEKRGTRALKNASEADNYSFGELLERWLNANRIRLKGSTESKYRYLIDRHIGPKLGKIPLSCLTSERINRFLSEKLLSGKLNGRGGLSPSYVKGMAIVIGSALRFADSEGLNVPKKITVHRPK